MMLKEMLARGMHKAPAAGPRTSSPLPAASAEPGKSAPVVGIIGAKGGVGATTLAVELSAVLASSHGDTTLVDAHLQHADVSSALGHASDYSLSDLLERMDGLDRSIFDACCAVPFKTTPALRVLGQPLSSTTIPKFDLTDLAQLVQKSKVYSQFFLIDLPRNIDKHLVNLTDACDRIVLVFEGNLPSVSMATRWLSIFHELGYDDERIICVLNRAGGKYREVEKQLHRCLSDREVIHIPNASSILWDCSTQLKSVALTHPQHAYSRAVRKLADHVLGTLS